MTIPSREAPIIGVSYWDAVLAGKWFGTADFNRSNLVNMARKEYRRTANSSASSILAGANSYLNVTKLVNNESQIRANRDLIMTGKTLNNISGITGMQNIWYAYDTAYRPADKVTDIPRYVTVSGGKYKTYSLPKTGEVIAWKNTAFSPATLKAGANLVADFSERIESSAPYYIHAKSVEVTGRPETITARNILLHAGTINTSDVIKATDDIVIQSDKSTRIATTSLTAGKDISILAGGNLDSWQSDLSGRNITLVSRSGNMQSQTGESVSYFNADGSRASGSLAATGDLMVTAGGNILFSNTRLPVRSKNISLVAGGSITLDKSDAVLNHNRPGYNPSTERAQQLFDQMLPGDPLWASGDITLSSGRDLNLKGIKADAGGSINLTSGGVVNLEMRSLSEQFSLFFLSQRTPELRSSLKAGKNILIGAASDVVLNGAYVAAGGSTTLQAGRNLLLGAYGYDVIDSKNDNNHDVLNVLASIRGAKELTLAANGIIQANGSTLTSNGNITLTSSGNMRFEAAKSLQHREAGKSWSESVKQTGVTINSGSALTVLSGGSILFQATRLLAKGALDVAAKGGWLYAQAMEESSHYEKKTTKRKWWGKKTTVKKTKHTTTNRVTEFTAGGNINLLSRDDSTYEASKISAGKNARLTSTHGKINFRAVKNTSFEQTVSTSKGFYIKQVNKGHSAGKWVLPSVYAGNKLTVDAAKGISADVKVKNKQALEGAISALGAMPGTEWLKNLNKRSDVQWSAVKDAYDSWNYKSQSLNPAVAAVIAVAAAAVTAGTGLAAVAGNTAITATGVTGTTASAAVYGSAYAGMTSLVSQAAVALVENKGNLSKTLKALGSSNSVKSLATSMAIGGALAGFDDVMKVAVSPDKARLPVLVKDTDWGTIAQRVAGQSVISSSLNTAINGGSYKDNLVNALLANVGSQINAEGAGLIGDNGEILGVPGKTVSHAVLAGISAEIGGGNGKGAAAGALAAELAGVILGDNTIKPEEWQRKSEQQAQMAKVLGATAGAVFTGRSDGVYSGANAGETTFRYNYLSHKQKALMDKDLAAAKTPLEKAFVLARWGVTSGKQDGAFVAGVVSGVPVEFVETAQAIIALATNPGEAVEAMKALIREDDAWSIVGESIKQSYITRLDTMKSSYQRAGVDGAYVAGLEFGKLMTDAAGTLLGVTTVAKSGVKLTTNAVKALEKAAAKKTPGMVDIRDIYRIEKDGSRTQMSWTEGNYKQGYPFEDYMATLLGKGTRTPYGFKTFDFFDEKSGVATSVKTLNTQTPARIQTPKQIYNSIKGNIDSIINYKTSTKEHLTIKVSDVQRKDLVIAVPKITTTQQWEQINNAIAYGKSKNVNVSIMVVR